MVDLSRSWWWTSVIIRHAQQMNFHREPALDEPNRSRLNLGLRRRIWWTIFVSRPETLESSYRCTPLLGYSLKLNLSCRLVSDSHLYVRASLLSSILTIVTYKNLPWQIFHQIRKVNTKERFSFTGSDFAPSLAALPKCYSNQARSPSRYEMTFVRS